VEIEDEFAVLEQFVNTERTGRSLLNYQPGKIIAAYGTAADPSALAILQRLSPHLGHLGKAGVRLAPVAQWPAHKVLRLIVAGLTVGIAVEGDVDLRKALDRIRKQRDENARESSRIEGKLGNAEFTAKAPPEVVVEHKQRLQARGREQELLASSERQLREMMA
jgi:valyl-tRNA synthetase